MPGYQPLLSFTLSLLQEPSHFWGDNTHIFVGGSYITVLCAAMGNGGFLSRSRNLCKAIEGENSSDKGTSDETLMRYLGETIKTCMVLYRQVMKL